jgi:hypothetical protein
MLGPRFRFERDRNATERFQLRGGRVHAEKEEEQQPSRPSPLLRFPPVSVLSLSPTPSFRIPNRVAEAGRDPSSPDSSKNKALAAAAMPGGRRDLPSLGELQSLLKKAYPHLESQEGGVKTRARCKQYAGTPSAVLLQVANLPTDRAATAWWRRSAACPRSRMQWKTPA